MPDSSRETAWRAFARPVVLCAAVLAGLAIGVPAIARSVRPPDSYVGTFTDFDTYLLAIAADLSTYRRLRHQPVDPALDEMADVAYRMHQKAIVYTTDGGWLFQPGGWDDHPDYRYIGYDEKKAGLAPRPGRHVVSDASHFTRFPLWLLSHRLAAHDSARARYYAHLEAGLCTQFFEHVVVPPSSSSRVYRFNNFMDGRNGLYRLNYLNRGSVWGYGPYQLSSTVLIGWWGFLGTPAAAHLYDSLRDQFPYSKAEEALYLGPVTDTAPFTDGRYELLTAIAARLASGRPATAAQSRSEEQLFQRHFVPELQASLWAGGNAESAQYMLMVPLHSAFVEDRPTWKQAFADQFQRYTAARGTPPAASLLGRLHYLYFASRFLVLAAQSGDSTLIPIGLDALVESQILGLWRTPTIVISQVGWGEPAFREFRSYEQWKLSQPKSYVASDSATSPPMVVAPGSCQNPRRIVATKRRDGE